MSLVSFNYNSNIISKMQFIVSEYKITALQMIIKKVDMIWYYSMLSL